jgi:hypothetical protein
MCPKFQELLQSLGRELLYLIFFFSVHRMIKTAINNTLTESIASIVVVYVCIASWGLHPILSREEIISLPIAAW